MKKITVFLLALLLLLSLCACNRTEPEGNTGETTSVSAYKSKGEYPKLQGQLTWEGLNSIPIKRSDMTTEEMRDLVVQFFRFDKNALWIPDTDYEFVNKGTVSNSVTGGQVYGSLPYMTVSSGNLYRLMDYMDEETGVVDIQSAGQNPFLLGNQCSFCAWWAWARVVNSANYGYTARLVALNGCVPVGTLLYDPELKGFNSKYGTDEVVKETDPQTLYENYAQLQKGDGIVNYTSAGHVVMISDDVHVERTAEGQIDPGRSYVTVIDQAGGWMNNVNEYGESYTHAANLDAKWTFLYLSQKNYLPFTYKEFLGQDPVEETEVTLTHQGGTITKDQIYRLSVQANYTVADLYVEIHDAKGNEILKVAGRCTSPDQRQIQLSAALDAEHMVLWGDWDTVNTGDKVTVYAQLGTGERPTLWEGTFTR